MLIPFETIAIILYLASITDDPSSINFPNSLLVISAAAISCFVIVMLEVIILLKRNHLYTKQNRLIIKLCNSFNKILSCGITLFLLDKYHIYNLYEDISPSLIGNYSLQNATGMAIYIVITLFTWLPWYYIHKRTNSGLWTYPSYLIFKFRYTFFILGIWLPGILITSYINSENSIISENDVELYTSILFIVVAWIFPVFLRKFWGCTKLEDKELIEKIQALANNAGVKIRGIYLWSLGGKSIPNAAMVGFLPPFQYLFISHGLINKLNEDEVLGVVGHELGHLKKRHILFYLLMSITLLGTLEPVIFAVLNNRIYTIVCLVGVFFLYIRFIFGWFSRRFEREADLYSAELLKDFRPLSRGLERIGLACGNIRNEASWHHYGIAERVWFLEETYYNIKTKKRFKKNLIALRMISIMIFVFLLCTTIYVKTSAKDSSILSNSKTNINYINTKETKNNWLEINAILGKDNVINLKNIQKNTNK